MSAPIKSNRLPIIVAIVTVTLITVVGVSRCSKPTATTAAPAPIAEVAAPQVRPSDADGPDATIRTLTAKLADAQKIKQDSAEQAERIKELETELAKQKLDPRFDALTEQLQQLTAQNSALQERLLQVEVSASAPEASMADIGISPGQVPNGLNGGVNSGSLTSESIDTAVSTASTQVQPAYAWVTPMDRTPRARQQPAVGNTLPTNEAEGAAASDNINVEIAEPPLIIDSNDQLHSPVDAIGTSTANENGRNEIRVGVQPRFTLPINATLLDNTAMTAFIGRVPVGGTVQDPYRFKILASADGLAASGFRLPPQIKQMVFSGSATGDWALSCVRGQVDSVTFVFEDGTIQTYGGDVASREGQSNRSERAVLGYISDGSGVPCISGQRVTNASSVLAARFGMAAAEATARGYAEAATTTTQNGLGGVVRTIDDAAKFGIYNGLAGGAADARQWLESRLGQIFDAVYAPPGAKVAIHIERQINLDYDPNARRLNYQRTSAVSTLD